MYLNGFVGLQKSTKSSSLALSDFVLTPPEKINCCYFCLGYTPLFKHHRFDYLQNVLLPESKQDEAVEIDEGVEVERNGIEVYKDALRDLK